MIHVLLSNHFDRLMRKQPPRLQDAISDIIEDFKDKNTHQKLKVHPLHGAQKGLCVFSVDYRHRIVFQWIDTQSALLLDFGDHSVYE